MTQTAAAPDLPVSLSFRTSTLSARKPTRFDLKPKEDALALMAAALDITAVSACRFKGEIRPIGRHDFELKADLAATVEQPCGITLTPVVTKLSETVIRKYIADMPMPEAEEIEMPEDDTSEPLPEVIDAGAVLMEALALALPLYPRAPGASLTTAVFAAPGTEPLRDEDLRPFAGLASLAGLIKKDDASDP
jgi:uncharacterized metal-binding protein YceD (DUF177 family)